MSKRLMGGIVGIPLLAGIAGYAVGIWLASPTADKLATYSPPVSIATPTVPPLSLPQVARAALPRTVTIEGFTADAEEFGTGWLLDRKGDFVTNAHVVANAISIRIRDRTGGTHVGKVMGTDAAQDVAVVRSADGFSGDPLRIGTRGVSVGDRVVAIASSRATGHGDITLEKVLGIAPRVHATADVINPRQATTTTVYTDMVEITGSEIYPGNSGGPMLDASGDVVGIVTLAGKTGDQAYAIPIARVAGELRAFAARSG